jgi:hypothetical protein
VTFSSWGSLRLLKPPNYFFYLPFNPGSDRTYRAYSRVLSA